MNFNLQPTLGNELIKIIPLKEADFEVLYQAASDPLIWEQHPEQNRYQRNIFKEFFKSAIESKGAFLVKDNKNGNVIGSTRFYNYDKKNKSIAIGYTFLIRKYWGGAYNQAMKSLMLDHAFNFVGTVFFHIGANNIRSQKAIEKLGARKVGKVKINFPGEDERLNFIYEMDKTTWKE